MYIQIIQSSSDPNAVSPNEGDACLVCYKGTFINGVKFDSGTTTLAPNQVTYHYFNHQILFYIYLFFICLLNTHTCVFPGD